MTQEKFKFPRTFHFPDSGSVGSDDKIFHDWEEMLWGKPVEITWKMDGENTTLCADGSVHARSVDSRKHWSRDDLTSVWKAKGDTLFQMVGELFREPDSSTQYRIQRAIHTIPLHCNH